MSPRAPLLLQERLFGGGKHRGVVTRVDWQTPLSPFTSYVTLNSLTLGSLISKKGTIAVIFLFVIFVPLAFPLQSLATTESKYMGS